MASPNRDTMPPFSRVAAVTGANKGIGLAVVRHLALRYPASALNDGGGPLLVYLCARDEGRGQEAVKQVESDGVLKEARALVQDCGLTAVRYHGLDVGVRESVLGFKKFLEREHPEGIDVVVNNAGIAMKGFGMAGLSSVSDFLTAFASLFLHILPGSLNPGFLT